MTVAFLLCSLGIENWEIFKGAFIARRYADKLVPFSFVYCSQGPIRCQNESTDLSPRTHTLTSSESLKPLCPFLSTLPTTSHTHKS